MSLAAPSSASAKPSQPVLGIYVHWPFCSAICPYCDFNVHAAHKNTHDAAAWRAAYRAELRHAFSLRGHGKVETVFFGGGTPSLMPPALVGNILADIGALWGFAPQAEISLEANPVSAPRPHLQDLHAAGINRLSLGAQAFDDAALKKLGRTHSAADARAAFEAAQDIFDAASFDLIYARPGQDLSAWQAELGQALALNPQHMSLYQLTIEPQTPFYKQAAQGRLNVPDEDMAARLYELTQDLCAAAGLPAYEISNHARAGFACRHNSAIWRGADYIGIGPGAHGRVSIDGRKYASMAQKQPEAWRLACEENGHGWQFMTPLSDEEAAEEAVMLGLRLTEGIGLAALARRGVRLAQDKIAALQNDGLLQARDDALQASDKGRLLLDYIIGRLLA